MRCPLTTSAGVYVLGALEPCQRVRWEAHLPACPPCQSELARLADLPTLLGRLSCQDVERLPLSLPEGNLGRLIAAIRGGDRRRRHRMFWAAGIVALTAAVIVGATVGARVVPPVSSPPASGTLLHAENPANHVAAAIALASSTSGTELSVVLTGARDDQVCELIARDRAGHSEVAGTWKASHRGTVIVPGSVAIPATQLVELDVLAAGGITLLSVPIHV